MSSSAPIVDRIRIIPRPKDFLDRNVGSSGEVFFDQSSSTLRVYSGKSINRGGFELARADLTNVDTSNLNLTNDDINWIPYAELTDLPPAVDNHGMFAHVHATGKAYYAHAGAWIELANASDLGTGDTSIDVSDVAPTEPTNGNLWLNTNNGKLYIYIDDGDSSQWVEPVSSVSSGGSLSDASTLNGETPNYYLDYTNFINTPSIPTTLTDIGISDGTNGQVLTTDGAGNFTFTTVTGGGGSGGVDLTAFSVGAEGTAAGDGSISYNNTTGVFTYTPPDLSSFITGYTETDTLASVTARGSSTSTSVTFNGAVQFGSTVTLDSITTTNAGTPELSSASTITLTAPDGIIATNPIKFASYTTTQRDLLTSTNGEVIYNSTTNKFQGYANGIWVDLH